MIVLPSLVAAKVIHTIQTVPKLKELTTEISQIEQRIDELEKFLGSAAKGDQDIANGRKRIEKIRKEIRKRAEAAKLENNSTLEVSVVDQDKKPMQGVRLEVNGGGPAPITGQEMTLVTKNDGSATFYGIPPAKSAKVRAYFQRLDYTQKINGQLVKTGQLKRGGTTSVTIALETAEQKLSDDPDLTAGKQEVVREALESINDPEIAARVEQQLESALTAVEYGGGEEFAREFVAYYRENPLAVSNELDANDYAQTKSGDTKIGYKLLMDSAAADQEGAPKGLFLASVLVHEYSHTGQEGSPQPVDEGRAYAIEQSFLSEAGGLQKREDQISDYLYYSADMDGEGRAAFLASTALMGYLRDRANGNDGGKSGMPRSVKRLTPEEAQQLMFEFTKAGKRRNGTWSEALERIATDVERGLDKAHRDDWEGWSSPLTPSELSEYLENHAGEKLIP